MNTSDITLTAEEVRRFYLPNLLAREKELIEELRALRQAITSASGTPREEDRRCWRGKPIAKDRIRAILQDGSGGRTIKEMAKALQIDYATVWRAVADLRDGGEATKHGKLWTLVTYSKSEGGAS